MVRYAGASGISTFRVLSTVGIRPVSGCMSGAWQVAGSPRQPHASPEAAQIIQ
jgi:hypothetical protein